jgi:RNA polymerase sigma-70 factor, ECF subfamily
MPAAPARRRRCARRREGCVRPADRAAARAPRTISVSLLYRIATNVCLNRIRDRGRRPAAGGARDDSQLEAIARAEIPGGESDARMLLDWLFNRHPESSRAIAVLHYVDGLTLEQVAGEVGLSVSGVRKRLQKLRDTVRDTGL